MQNILIALKWRQTTEEKSLNRKYVSGRWDANVHPNVHINMQWDNISYDNVFNLISRSQVLWATYNLTKYTYKLLTCPKLEVLIKYNLGRLCSSFELELSLKPQLDSLCSSPELEILSNFVTEFLIETRIVTFKKA